MQRLHPLFVSEPNALVIWSCDLPQRDLFFPCLCYRVAYLCSLRLTEFTPYPQRSLQSHAHDAYFIGYAFFSRFEIPSKIARFSHFGRLVPLSLAAELLLTISIY